MKGEDRGTDLEWSRLERILTPSYAKRDPADRLDEARRLVADARQLAAELSDPTDGQQVIALAWMVRLREIHADVALRGAVESFFVEHGWPAMRTRMLLRSLERLPDRPQSAEEMCVADAYTLRELGMVGFARALSAAGARGESLEAGSPIWPSLRKRLSRRLFTAPGRSAAPGPREELRGLVDKLRQDLAEH